MEYSSFAEQSRLTRLPASEIELAIRHHQRALAALEAGAFEALSPTTAQRLLQRMRGELEMLKQELSRRTPSC